MIQDALTVFFIFFGTFFMFVGSLGLLRFPDLYLRMHAQTKSVTLGLVSLLIASAIHLQSLSVTIKVICAIAFQFLTLPVGAHMIARAAFHHLKVKFWKGTIAQDWD